MSSAPKFSLAVRPAVVEYVPMLRQVYLNVPKHYLEYYEQYQSYLHLFTGPESQI